MMFLSVFFSVEIEDDVLKTNPYCLKTSAGDDVFTRPPFTYALFSWEISTGTSHGLVRPHRGHPWSSGLGWCVTTAVRCLQRERETGCPMFLSANKNQVLASFIQLIS